MTTRLLFVDDQVNVLSGIRRMLRSYRKQWDMEFASSGQDALELMTQSPFDVVVTDMRMPGIDGAALLGHVRDRWPETVRIVLSGQSDRERILCALGPAHQYLTKPCDAEKLTATVARCCELRDRLQNDRLKQQVSQLEAVPSSPRAIAALRAELELPHPQLHHAAEIIAGDVGMTAKVVQLVSSSFFGQPQRVESAEHAVMLLGVDILRELISTEKVFRPFDESAFQRFSLDNLTQHSIDVANCAYRLAQIESDDPQVWADSRMAGMLHDIGKVVLASCSPDDYRQAIELATDTRISLWEAEMKVFGASHAEVGSYLMGLWGAPFAVMEAIGLYRTPHDPALAKFSPLTAVHVANILCRKQVSMQVCELTLLMESEYLAASPFASRVPQWCEAMRGAVLCK